MLCKDTILVHSNIDKPLKLFCDASSHGVSTCNAQWRTSYFYISCALTSSESNFAQFEWAIIFGVYCFQQYLCSSHSGNGSPSPLQISWWKSTFSCSKNAALGTVIQCLLLFNLVHLIIVRIVCMSHLPSPTGSRAKAEKVHAVVITPDASHVLAILIAKASVKDKMIATIITAIQHGRWPI